MKFPWTIGIELTGVPRKLFDTVIVRDDGFRGTDWDRVEKFELMMRSKLGICGHVDCHCFEVPSPPFKSSSSMRRWFLRVRRIMKNNGLTPHHPKAVCGGGHIHVKVDNKLKSRLAKEIQSRPWLPWIFSQPDEEESCDNICSDGPEYWEKGGSVRITPFGTIEFRFFESPLNWKEQWDHVEFVVKYIKYVGKLKRPPQKTAWTTKELSEFSQQDCITGFRKLLGALGLGYQRYEKYVKRNMLPRWELGRRRR
jgi:hypothetical protein